MSGRAETIVEYDEEGHHYEVDHVGLIDPGQWHMFTVYCDGVPVAEFETLDALLRPQYRAGLGLSGLTVRFLTDLAQQAVYAVDHPPVYLVWSAENRLWWRADGAGYTPDVWSAGRYDEAGAAEACRQRSWSNGTPPEVMVLAPEYGRNALTVDEIRAVPDLMRDRIDEAIREAKSARGCGAR